MSNRTESTLEARSRGLGTTGRLVVGGTVSTGLLLGGFMVAAFALAGRMNGGALLPTSVGLFMTGALAGLVASVVAGLIGRPVGWTLREAGRDAGKGVALAIPSCLLGALVAGWMGMVVIGLYLGSALPVVGAGIAALVAVGIMAATLQVTVEACSNAIRRARRA